jgi:hypothetical protein
MRNVGEHIDDYLIGDGRAKDVQRGDLQVSTWDATIFNWLGVELDIEAASTLFRGRQVVRSWVSLRKA